MSKHKCELCGTPVKVVGKTTKHYEPLGPAASVPRVEDIEKLLFNVFSVNEYEKTKDGQIPLAKTATEASIYEKNKYHLRTKLQIVALELYALLTEGKDAQ